MERKRPWLRAVFRGAGALALVAVGAWARLNRGGPLPDSRQREPVVVLPFHVPGSAGGREAEAVSLLREALNGGQRTA